MEIVYAVLILLGLRHPAPANYHAPIKTLPLVIPADQVPLDHWSWGPPS